MSVLLDKLLFGSKHWQVFLLFVGAFMLEAVEIRAVPCLYLLWLPLIGIRMNRFLPAYYRTHYLLHLVAWGMMIVGYAITPFRKQTSWLGIGFFILSLSSFIMVFSFIARAVRSLETHDRATVNDYFGDIFLYMFFFPLGVWFIQPRLNLLYNQYFRD